MRKYALPTLAAVSLWAMALGPAWAQGAKPAPPKPAATHTPASAGSSEIAGSVNGKPITWTQLIARLQKDSPQGFSQAVAQAIGTEAAGTLFGSEQKPQFTITRAQALAMLRKQPPQAVRQMLDTMLTEESINQVATQEGIAPTEAQVNARMTKLFVDLRKQKIIPANMTDDQFLKSKSFTRAQLADSVRTRLKLVLLMQKDYEKTLGHPVGPDDFLQARHILLQVPPAGPTTAQADQQKLEAAKLAQINAIAADIKAGKETFEQEAKDNSDDPGSKTKGGDLGPFMRGMMVKAFETVAFSLKPGEISQPVKTDFGYHLIQVEKLGKDIPADQRQQIFDQFMEQYTQRNLPTFMTQLKQRAKVVNNLPPLPMELQGGEGAGQ
jgi:parvulin-like peptidyl-prolyl isomerase